MQSGDFEMFVARIFLGNWEPSFHRVFLKIRFDSDSFVSVLFRLFLAVYVFCFLSEAGVDLLVMFGVCELMDVYVVLCAFSSVFGGGMVGC